MLFEKQRCGVIVTNNDYHVQDVKKYKRHGKLIPDSVRALIVGPSNCGKTNVLLSLLESPHGLAFENVYIYSKSLQQPKYIYLEKLIKSIEGMGYHAFSENEQVIEPESAKPNSIFIFDDVACENHNTIRSYYARSRHTGACAGLLYLGQSYSRVPKHLVRDNLNLLILFKQDERNLRNIYSDHISSDMSFENFKKLCNECWNSNKYGFVTIDKDSPLNAGRYRKMLDVFVKFE